jgi:hypothetical protein
MMMRWWQRLAGWWRGRAMASARPINQQLSASGSGGWSGESDRQTQGTGGRESHRSLSTTAGIFHSRSQ